MLTQLEMAGVFDRVNGVVLGGFTRRPDHPDSFYPTIDEAIESIFREVRLPCVSGLNFSHQPVNAILPIGGWCSLDAEDCRVEFGYPLPSKRIAQRAMAKKYAPRAFGARLV